MRKYASTIVLEVNGQKLEDFKKFKEKPIKHRKQVDLMGTTGAANVTSRFGFSLDYVIPDASTRFPFPDVENGTATITYESGAKVIYTGVTMLEEGEADHDGENEITKTIDFMATGRREE